MEDFILSVPRNVLTHRHELENKGRVTTPYLLFADVSGFTRLTESLKETEGERAAEKIAKAIDDIVKPVSLEALRYNGNIIAIEGDALLVSFEDLQDALLFSKHALDFHKKREHNELGLSLDVGLSKGRFFEAVIGDDARRTYFTAGPGLKKVYVVEKRAAKNLVSDFHIPHISHPLEDGYFEIDLESLEEFAGELPRLQPNNYASSFLPDFTRNGITNEVARPGIIFTDIPIDLDEPERSTAALNRAFLDVVKKIERTGVGFVDKFKEYNSLFIIGAPFTTQEPARLSLEAICEIEASLSNAFRAEGFDVKPLSAGINLGRVFCGDVCGRYTVMGDAVNTSARIKEKASGKILVSDSIEKLVRDHTSFQETDIKLRSKKEGVGVFILESISSRKSSNDYILYNPIYEDLLERINFGYAQPGQGETIEVIGEIGSGRDRLISAVVNNLEGKKVVEVECSPVYSGIPFHLIFDIAKKLLSVESESDLYKTLGSKEPEILIPKILDLIYRNKAVYSITRIENADAESLKVLSNLEAKVKLAGSFVLTSSTPDPNGEQRLSGSSAQTLLPLNKSKSREFTRVLAGEMYGTDNFANVDLEFIVSRSKGNPLFISEMLKTARVEDREIVIDKNTPEKIEDIILINISRLDPALKEAIKTLSLLHSVQTFLPKLDSLSSLEENTEQKLEDLKSKGLLNDNSDLLDPLLKNAVSNLIPEEEKSAAYKEIADLAESLVGDSYLKAHYYMHAINPFKVGEPDESHYIDKFIEHLEAYIAHSDISRVPFEMLDKAVSYSANPKTKEQKRTHGLLLLGQVRMMFANALNQSDYKIIYEKSCLACDIFEEEPDYYRALRSKGRAACFLGNDTEGLDLLIEAEESALENNDLLHYLGTALSHSYILSNKLKKPEEGLDLLTKAESHVANAQQTTGWENEIGYIIPGLYKSIAECYLKQDKLDTAEDYIGKAIETAERFSVWHILAYGYATRGEILEKQGERNKAIAECAKALSVINDYSLNLKNFERELKEFIRYLKS